MNLFTFNSKNSFAIKVICCGFLLLISYALFLETPLFRYGGGVGSSDLQNCLIRAERFVFDLQHPETIIVGTSKSARIRTDLMGENIYNLSYPCLGDGGGLYYVFQKKIPPKVVILETGFLVGDIKYGADPDVLNQAIPLSWREHFKPLRQEYNFFLVVKFLTTLIRKWPPIEESYLPGRIDSDTGRSMQRPGLQLSELVLSSKKVMKNYTVKNDFEPSEKYSQSYVRYLNESCSKSWRQAVIEYIAENVSKLQQRGIKVILNEPPANSSVMNSECLTQLRLGIQKQIPTIPYFFDPDTKYAVPDGIHLAPDEAIVYSDWLVQKLKSIY